MPYDRINVGVDMSHKKKLTFFGQGDSEIN